MQEWIVLPVLLSKVKKRGTFGESHGELINHLPAKHVTGKKYKQEQGTRDIILYFCLQ